MRVALVHDYLKEYGGAERVLEALHNIYPDAPVYTAFYNPDGLSFHAQQLKKWDIRTSWFQKFPFAGKLTSPFRILAPLMFESFDLSSYDLVISSCNIYFAKAVITKHNTLHISYIHTPPRYLYGFTTSFNYKKHWWTKIAAEASNHILRIYDFATSQRPDILIANSHNVAARIKKFYHRDADVIYPPIDLNEFKGIKKVEGSFYLTINRLWKGKGIEIIIEACTKLDIPLKIAGSGPYLSYLQKIAGKDVEFLGEVTDKQRVELLSQAKGLIVASEDEDFGITAIESMAAGTPVIAIRNGGYLETVIEGQTGVFFDPKNSVESLIEVLKKFDPKKYKVLDCKKQAEKFSKERFKKEILQLVAKNI